MQGETNPITNLPYKSSDIDTLAPRINGFTERGKAIHVKKTVGIGTIVHEGMHLYQKNTFAWHVSEGFTEFFTRYACEAANLYRQPNYQAQLDAVDRLVAVTNEKKMADAYFAAKPDELIADVDKGRPDRWAQWNGFMAAGDFTSANALFASTGLPASVRGALAAVFSTPSPMSQVPVLTPAVSPPPRQPGVSPSQSPPGSPATPSSGPAKSSQNANGSGPHAPGGQPLKAKDPFAILVQQMKKELGGSRRESGVE
jgi:hypothetical protein